MKRQVFAQLIDWKNTPNDRRKPLILEGARQTGKTWLARELGKTEFSELIEINFEKMVEARNLFEANFDLNRILLAIHALTGRRVIAGETLLFFDEIQFARRGLLSLKYLKAASYLASASLLFSRASYSVLHEHTAIMAITAKITFLNFILTSFSRISRHQEQHDNLMLQQ